MLIKHEEHSLKTINSIFVYFSELSSSFLVREVIPLLVAFARNHENTKYGYFFTLSGVVVNSLALHPEALPRLPQVQAAGRN